MSCDGRRALRYQLRTLSPLWNLGSHRTYLFGNNIQLQTVEAIETPTRDLNNTKTAYQVPEWRCFICVLPHFKPMRSDASVPTLDPRLWINRFNSCVHVPLGELGKCKYRKVFKGLRFSKRMSNDQISEYPSHMRYYAKTWWNDDVYTSVEIIHVTK